MSCDSRERLGSHPCPHHRTCGTRDTLRAVDRLVQSPPLSRRKPHGNRAALPNKTTPHQALAHAPDYLLPRLPTTDGQQDVLRSTQGFVRRKVVVREWSTEDVASPPQQGRCRRH